MQRQVRKLRHAFYTDFQSALVGLSSVGLSGRSNLPGNQLFLVFFPASLLHSPTDSSWGDLPRNHLPLKQSQDLLLGEPTL